MDLGEKEVVREITAATIDERQMEFPEFKSGDVSFYAVQSAVRNLTVGNHPLRIITANGPSVDATLK